MVHLLSVQAAKLKDQFQDVNRIILTVVWPDNGAWDYGYIRALINSYTENVQKKEEAEGRGHSRVVVLVKDVLEGLPEDYPNVIQVGR